MKNILLLFFILLFSCKSEKAREYANLTPSSKIVNITIPPSVRQPIPHLSVYTDSLNNTFLYTWKMNQFIIIDITKQRLKKNIFFKSEGPNAVARISGTYINNNNEIYLWDSNQPIIYRIDSTCNILQKIHYPKTDDGIFITPGYSALGLEASIKHGVIQILMPETDYYDGIKMNLMIDTINHNIQYSDFDFVNVNSDGVDVNQYSNHRCMGENGFVYSLAYDHGVYVMDEKHKLKKIVRAQSKYIPEFDYTPVSPYDPNSLIKNQSKAQYHMIQYDKYRNVYYRLAFHKTDCIPQENMIGYLQFGRTDFSIMVLDKDFNCIAERLFDDHRYSSINMFVAPDGLYISRSHCYNEDYSDDLLQYERFDLVYD